MTRRGSLKGEGLGWVQVLIPLSVCALPTALGACGMSPGELRQAAVKGAVRRRGRKRGPRRLAGPDLALSSLLTPPDLRELQYIYMARQKVFAIEQPCAYLDADGFDEQAFHLAAWSSVLRPSRSPMRACSTRERSTPETRRSGA